MRHCQAAGALAWVASGVAWGGGVWEPAGPASGSAGPCWDSAAAGFGPDGMGCGCRSSDAVVAAFPGNRGWARLGAICLRAGFNTDHGHPSWANAGWGDAAISNAQQASTILMPLPPSVSHTADANAFFHVRVIQGACPALRTLAIRNLLSALLLGCLARGSGSSSVKLAAVRRYARPGAVAGVGSITCAEGTYDRPSHFATSGCRAGHTSGLEHLAYVGRDRAADDGGGSRQRGHRVSLREGRSRYYARAGRGQTAYPNLGFPIQTRKRGDLRPSTPPLTCP